MVAFTFTKHEKNTEAYIPMEVFNLLLGALHLNTALDNYITQILSNNRDFIRIPLTKLLIWSLERDSNPRPTAYEAAAPPLSYRGTASPIRDTCLKEIWRKKLGPGDYALLLEFI